MQRDEIISWLRQDDPSALERLWRLADTVRQENVGGEVHLRGLIEISSYCGRSCAYCGLRIENALIRRFRMSEGEILECAHEARRLGYGTVVLQSGEDFALDAGKVARLIRRIKNELPGMAVTLSLGEREPEELALWRESGADRYLLRFETSNRELYDRIHPGLGDKPSDRFLILRGLRELGYEIGSGALIGIPGQSYSDLAEDVLAFDRLDLDMIGSGPFIPHPDTPLGGLNGAEVPRAENQVPNDELTAYKVIALTRIVCPRANIPSTTALAVLNRESGRELGLRRGANVVMPNLTPRQYRGLYTIYPGKTCLNEVENYPGAIREKIEAIGRTAGTGRGDSPRHAAPAMN